MPTACPAAQLLLVPLPNLIISHLTAFRLFSYFPTLVSLSLYLLYFLSPSQQNNESLGFPRLTCTVVLLALKSLTD